MVRVYACSNTVHTISNRKLACTCLHLYGNMAVRCSQTHVPLSFGHSLFPHIRIHCARCYVAVIVTISLNAPIRCSPLMYAKFWLSGKFGIIWNKNIFCSGIKSNWNTNQRLLCSVATLTFPLSISLLTMSKCSPALFLTQPMAYLSIIYVAGQMCWKGRCCLLFFLFLRYSLWCWAGEFIEIQWAFCSNKLYELCSKQRVSENNGKPILFSNDILSAFSFHTFEFGIKTMSRRYWKSFQE